MIVYYGIYDEAKPSAQPRKMNTRRKQTDSDNENPALLNQEMKPNLAPSC